MNARLFRARRMVLSVVLGLVITTVAPTPALADPAGTMVTYIGGGTGEVREQDALRNQAAIAFDSSGNLFIADTDNNRIRKATPGTDTVFGTTDDVITTVAGTRVTGFSGDGGMARAARLNRPYGIAFNSSGELLIVDSYNYRIRKVTTGADGVIGAPNDVDDTITTIAGDGVPIDAGDGGPATSASFNDPSSIAIDSSGNIFISEYAGNRIRRIDTTGTVTTIANSSGSFGYSGDGASASSATFSHIGSLLFDSSGDLIVADTNNAVVRKISKGANSVVDATDTITTIVGNGCITSVTCPVIEGATATATSFTYIGGLAYNPSGDLYISDTFNLKVRRVNASTSAVTTVAGNGVRAYAGDSGPATVASLAIPLGLAIDSSGHLFLCDTDIGRVRRVDKGTGVVEGTTDTSEIITTAVGTGRFTGCCTDDFLPANLAKLSSPAGLQVVVSGSVTTTFLADSANDRVVKVEQMGASTTVTTIAGNGCETSVTCPTADSVAARSTSLGHPQAVAVSGTVLIIADTNNNRIRKVVAGADGVFNGSPDETITTIAGTGVAGFSGDGGPATSAKLDHPSGVVFNAAGDAIIADWRNNRVRRVDSAGDIQAFAFAGDGTNPTCTTNCGDGSSALSGHLNAPFAVAASADGVLIADSGHHQIRRVSTSGLLELVAGTGVPAYNGDGIPATLSSLNNPRGVWSDSAGKIYIADTNNNRIRIIDTVGDIFTIAGMGLKDCVSSCASTQARLGALNGPSSVAVDTSSDVNVYISDTGHYLVKKVQGTAPTGP